MIGRSSSFLGIAVSDRSVTCAEVTVSGERRVLRCTATFVFPSETSLDAPDAVGQALAAFLRQKGFTASRVVVGVPARWLIAVEKDVPPANEEQTRATLRLQAERLAVAESGEVVFDFAGKSSTSAAGKVLLVGMLRQRLEKVQRMMDAAGMSILAVTSSGLALASCIRPTRDDGGMLMLSRSGGEIVWRDGGMSRLLRHVPFTMNGHGTPPLAPLSAELRRIVAMAQQNGDSPRELLLLDGVGLAAKDVADLSGRLGVAVNARTGPQALDLHPGEGTTADPQRDEAAPAMSLALAGARTDLLPVNFQHSRLTPAPVQRVGRRAIWAIAIGTAALVALIWLFVSVRSRQSELDQSNKDLAGMKKDMTDAQGVIDRLNYGRGYFESNRPPILDCFGEISRIFHDDDRIWATSLIFRENGKGQLAGKAADQATVLRILDRLKKEKRFSDVKFLDLREGDARSHEMSFSISFGFDVVADKAE